MVYKVVKKLAKWIRKFLEEKSPKFIVLKTHGIMDAPNASMVSQPTLYGITTIKCPKCHSTNVVKVYTLQGYFHYKCLNCGYENT